VNYTEREIHLEINDYTIHKYCGSGMFIPDPDFYPSWIQQQQQRRRERKKLLFRIRDILVWIRICGSVLLTNGSGFGDNFLGTEGFSVTVFNAPT
jgi:hypothetical protein